MKVILFQRPVKTLLSFAARLGFCLSGSAATRVVEYDFNSMFQPVPQTAKMGGYQFNVQILLNAKY